MTTFSNVPTHDTNMIISRAIKKNDLETLSSSSITTYSLHIAEHNIIINVHEMYANSENLNFQKQGEKGGRG